MKKKLLAIAALSGLVGQAYAADVELFGVLDETLGTVNHSLSVSPTFPATIDPQNPQKANGTGSVTGLFNGGISPSRWGIRGSEDMGNGMKASFWLESGFNLPSGSISSGAQAIAADNALGATGNTSGQAAAATSINGQLFNRQAWVGIEDAKLGKLMFGRVYNPGFDIVVEMDPVQAAQLFSPLGFSGTFGGGLGATEDLRNDGSVRYTNKIGNVNFGGLYKFGGVAGSTSAQSGWVLNGGYDNGTLGIQGAYGSFKDVMNAGNVSAALTTAPATGAQFGVSLFNTQGTMIGAKYKVTDAATLKAGWQHFNRTLPSDPVAAANTLGTYYGSTVAITNLGSNRGFDTFWIGGDYNFTPNFNLAVGYYDIGYEQSVNGCGSSSTTNQCNGDLKYYSVLADYKLSKRTDVYAGAMLQTISGAQFTYPNVSISSTNQYYTNNAVYGVGIRHRF
jgi:predicted porin